MQGTYNNMVRVCTIKYANGKDHKDFLKNEDIDTGSVVLKQEELMNRKAGFAKTAGIE